VAGTEKKGRRAIKLSSRGRTGRWEKVQSRYKRVELCKHALPHCSPQSRRMSRLFERRWKQKGAVLPK